MYESQRRWLRVGFGLVILVLTLIEADILIQALRSQAERRERAVQAVRGPVLRQLGAMALISWPGTEPARQSLATELLGGGAAEVEIFSESGQPLLARPAPAPVQHWPSAAEREALRNGAPPLSVPLLSQEPRRVLTYGYVPSGPGKVLVRIASMVPASIGARQGPQLVGHALAVGLLITVGIAWFLFPRRGASGPPASALEAYEEAMSRLRERDVAAARLHDEERRRLLNALGEKDTMARAGELTTGIVHEVRNGLGTIAGYARLIEHGTTGEGVVDAARNIGEECRTLETVIARFIEFVRHEELHVAPVDLARMLSRVAARESRGRPGGTIVLPQALDDTGTVDGDEALLERAFENLVRNAREAAGPDGHVWIQAARREGDAVIVVSDDGPGLGKAPAEVLRPFFTTKAGGLGLGLPIAMKVVHLHNGELSLSPRSPTGLQVTVRLPREAGPA